MDDTLKNSLEYFTQSELAALAVLVSHVAKRIDSEIAEGSLNAQEDQRVRRFLEEVEDCAVEAIKDKDSSVVHWIGVAAKQMNPLLS